MLFNSLSFILIEKIEFFITSVFRPIFKNLLNFCSVIKEFFLKAPSLFMKNSEIEEPTLFSKILSSGLILGILEKIDINDNPALNILSLCLFEVEKPFFLYTVIGIPSK